MKFALPSIRKFLLRSIQGYPRWMFYPQALAFLAIVGTMALGTWMPAPGVAIGALGVAAVVMAVRGSNSRLPENIAWILIATALFIFESRAIYKDRADNEKEQAEVRRDEDFRFEKANKEENDRFREIIREDQIEFERTMSGFTDADRRERARFESLITEDKHLFEHEEQVAESLNGKLIPAHDPTPQNACPPIPSGGAVVMIGNPDQHNASVISSFPHTIILSRSRHQTLAIDKTPTGALALLLDMRSEDGKIIARLNKDGFVLNRNNYLETKKDQSSLIITDEYGTEVLNVRYINNQAISVSGRGIGLPKNMSFICSEGSASSTDISAP